LSQTRFALEEQVVVFVMIHSLFGFQWSFKSDGLKSIAFFLLLHIKKFKISCILVIDILTPI